MMPQTKNEPAQRLGAPQERASGGRVRQCAVTRESHADERLIRFVRSPDGVAVPDVNAKLPGRGVWIKAYRGTVEKGLKANVFSRAFKTPTQPMDGLCDEIERQLAARCIGLIGMAKKGGKAVIGFDQVRAYIRKDEPGWLLEASDGAKDGRNKVQFLAKAIYEDAKVAGALSSAELGMAFGREHVIHALLERGPLSEAFGVAYQRLIGFRPAPETQWFADRR
ncbi:MAG: RNA-binding protein [Alphaproteobacteria bacterium]|nr:RNA-binding protein [Alphaproteobacteria bacterium]